MKMSTMLDKMYKAWYTDVDDDSLVEKSFAPIEAYMHQAALTDAQKETLTVLIMQMVYEFQKDGFCNGIAALRDLDDEIKAITEVLYK